MVAESEPQPPHPATCWPHPGAGGSMGAFLPGMTSEYINIQRKGYQHLQLVLFFLATRKLSSWPIELFTAVTSGLPCLAGMNQNLPIDWSWGSPSP